MSHANNPDDKKIFIIKKVIKKHKHGHHGGAWKIAYADFVTAMMAFFLLMWLLSMMNKYQLMGVSEYFNKPMKEAFSKQSEQDRQERKGGKDRYMASEPPSGPSQYHGADHAARISSKNEVKTPATGMIEEENVKKGSTSDPFNRKMTDQDKDQNLTQIKDALSMAKDKKMLEQMRDQMLKDLDKNPELKEFKNMLNFVVGADGLKIEIHDLKDKPMFSVGNTDFASYAKKVIGWLATTLNQYPRRVAIIGHTDSALYESPSYSNWELSADRANATRRELINSGMKHQQIIRIIGLADTQLLDKKNPLDPKNRRIEVIVLSDEALKKLIN